MVGGGTPIGPSNPLRSISASARSPNSLRSERKPIRNARGRESDACPQNESWKFTECYSPTLPRRFLTARPSASAQASAILAPRRHSRPGIPARSRSARRSKARQSTRRLNHLSLTALAPCPEKAHRVSSLRAIPCTGPRTEGHDGARTDDRQSTGRHGRGLQ
jgi:hypothetical protein